MPVPASYNDITEDKAVRDHVGVAWYDRTFYVPQTWNSTHTKVWLRFGGVHYAADVVCLFLSTYYTSLAHTDIILHIAFPSSESAFLSSVILHVNEIHSLI
jgi:hypothetical protein